MADPDLYQLLGVARDASPDEVKSAFRRLARKYHPDVNPGDKSAEERFKKIGHAFEILGDPGKRALYDELGDDAAKIGWDPKKAEELRRYRRAGGGGFPGGFAEGGEAGFGGGMPHADFEDLFGEIFGGRGGFGGGGFRGGGAAGRGAAQEGEDLGASVTVQLADIVRGAERELTLQRPNACTTCNGSGTKGGAPRARCPRCGGSGRVRTGRGPFTSIAACPTCGGEGLLPGDPCPRCGGAGRITGPAHLTVRIPAGIADGAKMRLAGQGAAGRGGGAPGDLYLEIKVEPHPLVKRDGDDLQLALPLTVAEAVAGAEISLPTFDGVVTLKIPAGSQSGQKLRLRGKGVPHLRGGGRGDLFAELRVMVPTGPEAAKEAERLSPLYGKDVRAGLLL